MNSTSLTLETVTPQLDKNDTLRGWQLSDRLDWAMGLPVSPPARFVAVAIVKHTGAETRLAWPSMATLAGLTGYSKATVKRAVRELEKGAHFDITRLKIGRKNTSNRYRVPVKGWGQSDPMGGVRVTPEPVKVEPVNVHTQGARERLTCEQHGRSWPESWGLDCFECNQERTKQPKRTRGGRSTDTIIERINRERLTRIRAERERADDEAFEASLADRTARELRENTAASMPMLSSRVSLGCPACGHDRIMGGSCDQCGHDCGTGFRPSADWNMEEIRE